MENQNQNNEIWEKIKEIGITFIVNTVKWGEQYLEKLHSDAYNEGYIDGRASAKGEVVKVKTSRKKKALV